MNEQELRELDAKVLLYPNDRILGLALYDTPCACGFLPRYTTDIGAWESVYALKPEWRWSQDDGLGVLTVLSTEPGVRPFVSVVEDFDATGLAAYALGRSRCVLAWAEVQR
jgi:hypothetical protein